jgi:hypothetical protein
VVMDSTSLIVSGANGDWVSLAAMRCDATRTNDYRGQNLSDADQDHNVEKPIPGSAAAPTGPELPTGSAVRAPIRNRAQGYSPLPQGGIELDGDTVDAVGDDRTS